MDGICGFGEGECLGSSNMHDSVVTVLPIKADFEGQWSFVVGDGHHFLVDELGTSVELPGAVLITHGVSNGCKHHCCLEVLLTPFSLH